MELNIIMKKLRRKLEAFCVVFLCLNFWPLNLKKYETFTNGYP